MSLLVELRDYKGDVLARAGEIDGVLSGRLPDAIPPESFPMIKHVDRYGDTIFNTDQMEDVVPELRRLRANAQTELDLKVVESILGLAIECSKKSGRFLVFIGD